MLLLPLPYSSYPIEEVGSASSFAPNSAKFSERLALKRLGLFVLSPPAVLHWPPENSDRRPKPLQRTWFHQQGRTHECGL